MRIIDRFILSLAILVAVTHVEAALAENAQHYLDNPKDINDRDSFHWHAEMTASIQRLEEGP